MSKPKKKPPSMKGEYRTLMVDVDSGETDAESESTRDAPVPEPLASSMQSLDFSNLEADRERERRATAGSSGEARLVAYFDGVDPWSDDLVAIFISETRGAEVNDDLFLRYLNQGHPRLITLLTHAVEAYPADPDLLYDLAYLVRGGPSRIQMIPRYRHACINETDPERFRSLVADFFELVIGEDQTAVSAERRHFEDDPRKLALFDLIAGQYES